MDRLEWMAVVGGDVERGAQHFMATNQRAERSLECGQVQVSFHPNSHGDVECGARGIELIQHPHAFLRVSERRAWRSDLPARNHLWWEIRRDPFLQALHQQLELFRRQSADAF